MHPYLVGALSVVVLAVITLVFAWLGPLFFLGWVMGVFWTVIVSLAVLNYWWKDPWW